eukprot:817747_1
MSTEQQTTELLNVMTMANHLDPSIEDTMYLSAPLYVLSLATLAAVLFEWHRSTDQFVDNLYILHGYICTVIPRASFDYPNLTNGIQHRINSDSTASHRATRFVISVLVLPLNEVDLILDAYADM